MYASFRAFMQGLIDYAGLFPPARLTLQDALNNYMNYLNHPSGWMLSNFICPVQKLSDLESFKSDLQKKIYQNSSNNASSQ